MAQVAARRPQLDPEDDPNWLAGSLKCICNLCECGHHSCANFKLLNNGARLYQFDDSANEDNYNNNNNNEDKSSSRRKAMDSYASMADTGDRKLCHCAPHAGQERYLSPTQLPRQSQASKEQPKDAPPIDDDELVHVLVTRPTIASKPRDHIIFEGDMDLKTTFETSYEALARMRLDCWKKYQESKQHSTNGREKKASEHSIAYVSDKNSLIHRSHRSHADTNLAGPISSSRTANAADASCEEDASGAIPEPDVALTPEPASKRESISKLEARANERTEKTIVRRQVSQPFSVAESELITADKTASGNADPNYVDPDLRSIIIYDSNMNRLERVGLRKRSKYRPSTSLRPGARGLFGDQEAPAESTGEDFAAGRRRHKQPVPDYGAGKPSVTREEVRLSSVLTGLEPNAPEHERNRVARQANYGRNLGGTSRAAVNSLTYSQQILPVDSKRQLRNNINMTDHIKEHHIVDGGQEAAMDVRVGVYGNFDYSTENEASKVQAGEMNAEELNRLNELEEAAAVAEIQRATAKSERSSRSLDTKRVIGAEADVQIPKPTTTTTRKVIQAPNEVKPEANAASETPSVSTADSSVRQQSRLHKTCQQQNFYIYENEYPEPNEAQLLGKSSVRIGRNSPMDLRDGVNSLTTRNHKNLFRESPDFIMTTGKFHDQLNNNACRNSDGGGSSLRATAAGQSVASKAITPSSESRTDLVTGRNSVETLDDEADYYNHSHLYAQQRDQSPSMLSPATNWCRVLKLDDDFQFVESRSGHKYFVQKPPSPIKS